MFVLEGQTCLEPMTYLNHCSATCFGYLKAAGCILQFVGRYAFMAGILKAGSIGSAAKLPSSCLVIGHFPDEFLIRAGHFSIGQHGQPGIVSGTPGKEEMQGVHWVAPAAAERPKLHRCHFCVQCIGAGAVTIPDVSEREDCTEPWFLWMVGPCPVAFCRHC